MSEPSTAASASFHRHALLIGVDSYINAAYFPPLRYCANDVDALGASLHRHAYQVTCLVSPRDDHPTPPSGERATWTNIRRALDARRNSFTADQTFWLHFSGHGRRTDNGQNYLIVEETSIHDLTHTALRVADVIAAMRASGAGRLLLTVDACQVSAAESRDGYDPAFAAALDHIALHEASGFVFLAATGAGNIAWEHEGALHGVFSSHLIEGVRGAAARHTGRDYVTVTALADYVRVKVGAWNEQPGAGALSQTPTRHIDADGDFALTDRLDSETPLIDGQVRTYLAAVDAECATLRLLYAPENGRNTLPLQRVYVALAADESSPAERRASTRLLERQARALRVLDPADEQAIWRALAFDPYATRHLSMDPELAGRVRPPADRRRYLAQVAREQPCAVLLGHPGSGKSTLTYWLALQMARALLDGQDPVRVRADHVRPAADGDDDEVLGPARLPVLVRLADYAAARWGKDGTPSLRLAGFCGALLEKFPQTRGRAQEWALLVERWAARGRVIYLFDGLDEVADEGQRQTIAAEIEEIIARRVQDAGGRSPLDPGWNAARAPAANQVLVTSRIVGYSLKPLPADLPHFVIQPMDDDAVRRFCLNWAILDRGDHDGAAAAGEALAQAVLGHTNPVVRNEMARTPLLLMILAQVHATDPDHRLPDRRVALYDAARTAVFSQRREEWRPLQAALGDASGRLLPAALQRLTARVAFELHANPDYPAALAPRAVVAGWLAEGVAKEPALAAAPGGAAQVADDLLAAATALTGFFVARGQSMFGFLHRQFQEDFAALHLVAQLPLDTRDQQAWAPLDQRLDDPAWREVLLLAVGHLDARAEPFLRNLLVDEEQAGGVLPHRPLFVSVALRELAEPSPALVEATAAALIVAYRRDDDTRFDAVGDRVKRTFAALPRAHDAPGRALAAMLCHDDRLVRLAAAELATDLAWWTQVVVRALLAAWQQHVEPAGTLLAAIDAAYAAVPSRFAVAVRGALHCALAAEPDLWTRLSDDPLWSPLLAALYALPNAPWQVEALVRESALTQDLLAHVRAGSDRAAVTAWLWQCYRAGEDAAARDAGLALIWLGEVTLVQELVIGGNRRQLHHAMLAASSLDRARARGRSRDLDRVLDPSLALARALARTLALALANDRSLARAIDRALDRDLALARSLEVVRDRARSRDVARVCDGANALTRSLELARDRALARDLDLTSARDIALTRAIAVDRALARDLDLAGDLVLARALALDVVRITGVMRTVDEIAVVTATALMQFGDHTEVAAALDGAESRLTEWRALAGSSGVIQVWSALAGALADDAGTSHVDGSRLAASAALLSEPAAVASRAWADLLPRLVIHGDADNRAALANVARTWLDGNQPAGVASELTQRHAALLLGELGSLEAALLPFLLACLEDPADLTRYRARAVLHLKRSVRVLGKAYVEALTAAYPVAGALTATYVDWSLKELIHDDGGLLRAWAAAERRGILGRIHRLDDSLWPVLLHLLAVAAHSVQEELLDASRWLLRLGRVPEYQLAALLHVVAELAGAGSPPAVCSAALVALGAFAKSKVNAAALELLPLDAPTPPSRPAWLMALARLGAAVDPAAGEQARVRLAALASGDPVAAAALVRWHCTRQASAGTRDDELALTPERAALLLRLESALPEGAALLDALLAAGADDDYWGNYHATLAALAADVVQRDGALLLALLDALETALAGSHGDWPPRRIALAALAAAAAAMPDALNDVLTDRGGDDLLVQAARDAGSFNSRRFAIRAMSHLRAVTPAVLAALQAAAGDVATVQRQAMAAVGGFRHLGGAFAEDPDAALAEFETALQGPSAAAAYLAAGLLGALGSAPAARQAPALRRHIEVLLVATYRSPGAARAVWLLDEDGGFSEHGTVAAACLVALIRVTGLPDAPPERIDEAAAPSARD